MIRGDHLGIGHLGKSGNFRAKTLLGGHLVGSTPENRLGNIGKVGHLGIFWAVGHHRAVGQMPTGGNHERGRFPVRLLVVKLRNKKKDIRRRFCKGV